MRGALVLLAALTVGCGGSTTLGAGGSAGAGGAGGAGAGGAGGTDGGHADGSAIVDAGSPDRTGCVNCAADCPDTFPVEGSACTGQTTCQYGACPDIPVVATCSGGAWKIGWSTCASSPDCPAAIPSGTSADPMPYSGPPCTYVDPCCGGTSTWTFNVHGGWKPDVARCSLPAPVFPASVPTGSCPICVDQSATRVYSYCSNGAGQTDTLQCVGGKWYDMSEWDVMCGGG